MASVDPLQTIAMPSSGKETTSSDQIEDAKSAIDLAVPDMKEQRATLTDQEVGLSRDFPYQHRQLTCQ